MVLSSARRQHNTHINMVIMFEKIKLVVVHKMKMFFLFHPTECVGANDQRQSPRPSARPSLDPTYCKLLVLSCF